MLIFLTVHNGEKNNNNIKAIWIAPLQTKGDFRVIHNSCFFVQRMTTEHTMLAGQQGVQNVWTIYGVKIHVNEFNTISVNCYNWTGEKGWTDNIR